MKNILLLAFGILVSATIARAQLYSYDSTFATGEKNYWVAHHGSVDYFYASAADASGGVYFSGWTGGDGPQRSVLAHLDRDGNVLPSGDIHKIPFDDFAPQGTAIKLQPDGKPVVLNSLADSDKNTIGVGVYRTNADGVLDSSFGVDGKFQLFLPDYDFLLYQLYITPAGEFMIIGGVQQIAMRANHWSMVMRLNADGSLDSTFGTDSVLKFNRGNYLTSLEILIPTPDGRMVVACTEKTKQFWEVSAEGEAKEIVELSGDNGSETLLDFFDYRYVGDKLYIAAMHAGTRVPSVIQLSGNLADSTFGIDTIYEAQESFSVQDATFLADGNIVYVGFKSGIPKVVMLDIQAKEVADFTSSGALYEPTQNRFNVPYTVCQASTGDLFAGGQNIRGVADSIGQDFYALRMENLTTLSVKEQTTSGVQVYPVPFGNRLTIAATASIDQVQVLDQLGKVHLDLSPTTIRLEVDMTALPAGFYYIEIMQGDKSEVRRVVKE